MSLVVELARPTQCVDALRRHYRTRTINRVHMQDMQVNKKTVGMWTVRCVRCVERMHTIMYAYVDTLNPYTAYHHKLQKCMPSIRKMFVYTKAESF